MKQWFLHLVVRLSAFEVPASSFEGRFVLWVVFSRKRRDLIMGYWEQLTIAYSRLRVCLVFLVSWPASLSTFAPLAGTCFGGSFLMTSMVVRWWLHVVLLCSHSYVGCFCTTLK